MNPEEKNQIAYGIKESIENKQLAIYYCLCNKRKKKKRIAVHLYSTTMKHLEQIVTVLAPNDAGFNAAMYEEGCN